MQSFRCLLLPLCITGYSYRIPGNSGFRYGIKLIISTAGDFLEILLEYIITYTGKWAPDVFILHMNEYITGIFTDPSSRLASL